MIDKVTDLDDIQQRIINNIFWRSNWIQREYNLYMNAGDKQSTGFHLARALMFLLEDRD